MMTILHKRVTCIVLFVYSTFISLSLSLPLSLPLSLSLQLPSNPHPTYEIGDITPEVLENPLKNFPKLKDSEINAALTEYEKANERPSVEERKDNTGKERETAVSKTTSASTLSPLRWVYTHHPSMVYWERERERETDRQTHTHTQRERERERERER